MGLTLMQRALRPILNWAVERYFPKGCFFGMEYFDMFREFEKEDGSQLGQASALWITHNMHDQDADELDMRIKGLTIRGEPVGDFHIVVTRTTLAELEGETDGR